MAFLPGRPQTSPGPTSGALPVSGLSVASGDGPLPPHSVLTAKEEHVSRRVSRGRRTDRGGGVTGYDLKADEDPNRVSCDLFFWTSTDISSQCRAGAL